MTSFTSLSLTGKTALVCGASRGIGRACALKLAQRGASVLVLARNESALKDLSTELKSVGAPHALPVALDLEKHELVRSEATKILANFGPIHILINNAGGPSPGPVLKAKPEDFMAAFQRHLFASHTLVQTLLPGMVKENYGRVINIVSTSVREPIPSLGVSNTLRAAMAAWAKTLSMEVPPHITINNVLPGFTATERLESLKQNQAKSKNVSPEKIQSEWLASIPEGRLAQPEEIAEAVAFLASPSAAYIRGVSLPVDGGRLRSL